MSEGPGGSLELGRQVWAAVRPGPVLLVPLGATEQHGPHLPLATDSIVAAAVAGRVAERLHAGGIPAVVAPVLAYGSSGEHDGFPGTISIGQAALELLLVELVRSATAWASAVVLVNGHGGNREPVERAVGVLHAEQRRVLAWWPAVPGGDAHAGRTETSLLLALTPDLVDRTRAEAGATVPLAALLPDLRRGGVRAVSPNGVLGDPAGASRDEGLRLLDALADDAVTRVRSFL